jgi:restriction endonuclease S subunit
MYKKLNEIANIKAGHPFRGKITEDKNGDVYAIQIKDLNNDGVVQWEQLIQTNLSSKKSPTLLQKGDVIFAARGSRNTAGYIDEVTKPTVCAPHYYVIQITADDVLPEFIAWQLNQENAQRYFKGLAEGSSQVSIRKTLLEEAPIVIPPMETQRAIAGLDNKIKQEKLVLEALINNRDKQMQGIAKHILG